MIPTSLTFLLHLYYSGIGLKLLFVPITVTQNQASVVLHHPPIHPHLPLLPLHRRLPPLPDHLQDAKMLKAGLIPLVTIALGMNLMTLRDVPNMATITAPKAEQLMITAVTAEEELVARIQHLIPLQIPLPAPLQIPLQIPLPAPPQILLQILLQLQSEVPAAMFA